MREKRSISIWRPVRRDFPWVSERYELSDIPGFPKKGIAKKGNCKFWQSATLKLGTTIANHARHSLSCFHQSLLPHISSWPTFCIHIPSCTQENVSPPALPTTMTIALPGSVAEDLLVRRAPAPKPPGCASVQSYEISAFNYEEIRALVASGCGLPSDSDAMDLDIALERDSEAHIVAVSDIL